MFRIWAKTIKDHKITGDTMYRNADKFNEDDFLNYMTDICYDLDIPTPVILKSHIRNFRLYNIAKFHKEDFVESVPFDLLQIENAAE